MLPTRLLDQELIMEVTVSKWNPKHDGNLVGFADLVVNDTIEIRGCALRKGKEGTLWISVPSRKYEAEGKTKWIGHVGFPSDEHYKVFQQEGVRVITQQDNDQRFSNDDDMPF